jgi:hypothetical protein
VLCGRTTSSCGPTARATGEAYKRPPSGQTSSTVRSIYFVRAMNRLCTVCETFVDMDCHTIPSALLIHPVEVNEPPLFFDPRAVQPRWTTSVGRGRAIARCTSLGLICDMPRPCPWTSPTAESSNSRYFACAEYRYPISHNSSSVTLLPGTR